MGVARRCCGGRLVQATELAVGCRQPGLGVRHPQRRPGAGGRARRRAVGRSGRRARGRHDRPRGWAPVQRHRSRGDRGVRGPECPGRRADRLGDAIAAPGVPPRRSVRRSGPLPSASDTCRVGACARLSGPGGRAIGDALGWEGSAGGSRWQGPGGGSGAVLPAGNSPGPALQCHVGPDPGRRTTFPPVRTFRSPPRRSRTGFAEPKGRSQT